jgi:hypothetical protein
MLKNKGYWKITQDFLRTHERTSNNGVNGNGNNKVVTLRREKNGSKSSVSLRAKSPQ